jgi:hypothetical protein
MQEDARADGHTDMMKLTAAFTNSASTVTIYSLYVVQVESLLIVRITRKIQLHALCGKMYFFNLPADSKHEIR